VPQEMLTTAEYEALIIHLDSENKQLAAMVDKLMEVIDDLHDFIRRPRTDDVRQYPRVEIDGQIGIDYGGLIAFPPGEAVEAI
jgi:hypothetical protein